MVIRINPKMANGLKVFSGLHFLAFGLNMDQKNSEHGHFSRSVCYKCTLFGQEKLWRLCIFQKYGTFGLDSLAAALQISLGKDFTIFLMAQRISHVMLLVSFCTP